MDIVFQALQDVKKACLSENDDDTEEEKIPEVFACFSNLNKKVDDLAAEELRLKNELSNINTKKAELMQEKTSLGQKFDQLQVDIESLNKNYLALTQKNEAYAAQLEQYQSLKLSRNDQEKIRKVSEKLKLYKKLTNIKFNPTLDKDLISGYIYNKERNYIKHFQIKDDAEASEKLWDLIKKASYTDWSDLTKMVEEDLKIVQK